MLIGWVSSTYLNLMDSDGKRVQGVYAEVVRISAKVIKIGECKIVERALSREETLGFATVLPCGSGWAVYSLPVLVFSLIK